MNKRLSLYQIFMVTMTTIIATMLVAMGVIAINKSMTLKLGLKMNPSMLCAIYVNDNLVFNNKTSEIASGVSLSANELRLNSTNTFGAYFNLKIENLNEFAINISLSGCTVGEVEGYETAILPKKDTGNIEISSAGLITITMTEADVYYVQYNANNGGGEMATSTHIIGASSALSANAFTAPSEDVEFAGWATSANGEVVYENNALILNAATPNTTIQLYAVWKMKGYNVTFATNNWAATYEGEEVDSSLVVDPNGNLTVTVAGSGTQEGYSVHTAPTITGTVTSSTFDRYTGTLTLTNIQSDLTISATDFRPWTYHTYASDHVWAGYKYITFANNSQYKSNFMNGAYDMNWIIIGAGSNVNDTLSGVPTDKLPTTAYGGTLNSVTGGNTDNLEDNQVLLFSEYILRGHAYLSDPKVACGWSESYLRGYLNDAGDSNFLEESGLSEYLEHIKSDNVIKTGSDTTEADQSVFLLATSGSFEATIYLGSLYSDERYKSFTGASFSIWWLRTASFGTVAGMYTASVISNNGTLSKKNSGLSAGIRPCFVLNLA